MPTNNRVSQQTSTQIRTIFGDNSYLNLRFFNARLSITICRKVGVDQNGKPLWDNGITTTLSYEQAVQFIEACKIFLKDPWKPVEVSAQIVRNEMTVALNAVDTKSPSGFVATLTVSKNNEVYTFQFDSMTIKARNETTGQMTDVQIQTHLRTFLNVLESYVAGINSDRHLDKMTDDYAKAKGEQQPPPNNYNQNQGQNNYNQRGNWNRNNGGNRRWNNNNNGGGNRNYNNGGYRN